jgi:hypothetical protein
MPPDITSWSVNTGSCSISVQDLVVYDPPTSSCFKDAWLTYKVNAFGCTRNVSPSTSDTNCGGGTASGTYNWLNKIDTGELSDWESQCGETIPENPIDIEIWARVEDNAGNVGEEYLGTYSLDSECAPSAD